MSETLLDRAKSNLKAAKMNLSFKDSDKFYVNLAGYLTQQTKKLRKLFCFRSFCYCYYSSSGSSGISQLWNTF